MADDLGWTGYRPAAPIGPAGGASGGGSAVIAATQMPTEVQMSKLTPNQKKILSFASARRGGAILPLPDDVKLGASALKTTLASLVKQSFVIERGKHKKPVITKAGRTVVGAKTDQARCGGNQRNGSTSSAAIRPGTKQALLLTLLTRANGAPMSEMTKATGWQSHSVRAALTGLRKRGYEIERNVEAGASRYRVIENRKNARS